MEGDTFFHVPFVRWVRPSRLLELENGPFPCCWLRVETKWMGSGGHDGMRASSLLFVGCRTVPRLDSSLSWRIALRSVGGTHWSVSAGCDAEMRVADDEGLTAVCLMARRAWPAMKHW
jgi:hypothetical protein